MVNLRKSLKFSLSDQELWRRRRQRRNNSGFTCKFALAVATIGIMLGILLKLSLSSTPSPIE